MDRRTLHAVTVHGTGDRTIVLGHGLGGDQRQWAPFVAHYAPTHTVVTFDLAGSGASDPSSFSPHRHADVLGFADDLAAVCADEVPRGATFIGHSMSGMAGLLAAAADPGLFSQIVTIGTSACYVDHPEAAYAGGFSAEAVEELLRQVDADFSLWAAGFAPALMQHADRPRLAEEFLTTLRAYTPERAATVFRAAFSGDFRDIVARVEVPVLVLQGDADPAVPLSAARWLAEHLPHGELEELPVAGHFPHVAEPQLVLDVIDRRAGAL